mmetsp:Transcript_13509/g.31073  ORF Transcript_13509/g.31073 Transcript_13509/m.31073 type:complete len:887 (-) Transcript_13509:153-2813(-)
MASSRVGFEEDGTADRETTAKPAGNITISKDEYRPHSARFKGKEYANGFVDGRLISYYFLGPEAPLSKLVHDGIVGFDTEFTVDIEHCCDCENHKMTMRHIADRYTSCASALQQAIAEGVGTLFPTNVVINSSKRRGPRLGSFEVLLSWTHSRVRHDVLLFSKLETRHFPNPPALAQYLYDTLNAVRQVEVFRIIVRGAQTGEPIARALVQLINEDSGNLHSEASTNMAGAVDIKKMPFGPYRVEASCKDSPTPLGIGQAMFHVDGSTPRNICVPLPPVVETGVMLIVLTWASEPLQMMLYIRTPSGLLSAENPVVGSATLKSQGPGFGPVTATLQNPEPGSYHVYVQPTGMWMCSNAQVAVINSQGTNLFSVPEPTESPENVWWDCCCFAIDEQFEMPEGARSRSRVTMEEPGFGEMQVAAIDLLGQRVVGADVSVKEPTGRNDSYGTTDEEGLYKARMPPQAYSVAAHMTGMTSAPTTATLRLDEACIQGYCPLVPETADGHMRVILSWTGDACTPTLCVEQPHAYTRHGPDTEASLNVANIVVSGPHVASILLTAPLANPAHVYVTGLEGKLDKLGLQLSLCPANEPIAIYVPPAGAVGTFWDAVEISSLTDVKEINQVQDTSPATCKSVTVCPLNMGESGARVPNATITMRRKNGVKEEIQLVPGASEEKHTTLPFGEYIASLVANGFLPDERHISVQPEVDTRIGFVVSPESSLAQKHARLALTWARKPDFLELQIVTPEGILNSENTNRGNTRLEMSASGNGYGPMVISFKQPLAGKFKIQVVNTGLKVNGSMLAAQPEVTLHTAKGAMEGFTWRFTEVAAKQDNQPKIVGAGGDIEVWHVATLDIEEHTKFDADSVVATPHDRYTVEATVPEKQGPGGE